MEKINFQTGTKISSAKVTIDGTDHEVTPAQYEGATPLNPTVLNRLQTNIENAITNLDTKVIRMNNEVFAWVEEE